VREKIFSHYGKYCVCCGEENLEFLTIDHISNDGADHRKKITKAAGVTIYKWLTNNNFPPGFQTLCFNCNQAKHSNKGSCPCNSLLNIELNSYYNRVKLQVMTHCGGKCSCCFEERLWFLSIDHIAGDGHEKRKVEGTGAKLYFFLRKNNFPSGYQVLCHNCNSSKGVGKVCVHSLTFAKIVE